MAFLCFFHSPQNVTIRRIQIKGTGVLSLAEVEAFASCTEQVECTFYADSDGDGYGDPNQSLTQVDCDNIPAGYVANDQDFDDTERTAYPGAMEICDDIDNDNNGQIDEGATYDTDNMTFTNEVIPTEVYTASQTILTNQAVSVATNTNVKMIAGASITLKPGFTATAGATFLAKINADCGAAFQEQEIANSARKTNNQTVLLGEKINLAVDQTTLINTNNQSAIKVYPNPFKENTTVQVSLKQHSTVTLQVYDINGRLVTTILQNKRYGAGEFALPFTSQNYQNGGYYFMLTTADEVLTEKVMVIGN